MASDNTDGSPSRAGGQKSPNQGVSSTVFPLEPQGTVCVLALLAPTDPVTPWLMALLVMDPSHPSFQGPVSFSPPCPLSCPPYKDPVITPVLPGPSRIVPHLEILNVTTLAYSPFCHVTFMCS